MTQTPHVIAPDLGKKCIRFVVALAGLLILRTVLGSLPMLANASVIGNSLMSPLVIADAIVDTLIIIVILQFGLGLGRTIGASVARLPALGGIISLVAVLIALTIAYRQYETPVACLVVSPADLLKFEQTGQADPQFLQALAQSISQVLQGLTNTQVAVATRDTLAAYQHVAVMVLRRPPDLYGWLFLALILLPIVGIVVLVSRNLDSFTNAIFHAASSSWASGKPESRNVASDSLNAVCANCGAPTGRSKFCQHCGAPSNVPTLVQPSARACSACGSSLPSGAKFCLECGKAA
jgi:hypothetical protein